MSDIKLCPVCDGEGQTKVDEGTHNSDWVWYECKKCNGTGRIRQSSYSFSIPFGVNLKDYYKVSSDIVNQIRELDKTSYE